MTTEWFPVSDHPAISGRYLIFSKNVGWTELADYSSMKKRWTIGQGFDLEVCNLDCWAHLP